MIDVNTLFDYYTKKSRLDYRNCKISLFGIVQTGPALLLDENQEYLLLDNNRDYFQEFAVYSMVTLTQGNYYQDEVALIPLGKYPRYQALVIGILLEGEGPIHTRYFQVVLFLSITTIRDLPNPIVLRKKLLDLVYTSDLLKTKSLEKLLDLKRSIIIFLEEVLDNGGQI